MDKQQTVDVICNAALGFGAVGLVAPGVLLRAMGFPVDGSMLASERLIATRNIALGVIPRLIDVSDDYDAVLGLVVAMNALDCLGSVVAGARGQVPKRGAFTLAVLTAGLAVAAALPLFAGD